MTQTFIQDYFEKLKLIQEALLSFLDDENNQTFESLTKLMNEQKITENKDDFKLFLHLLCKISNNHHRTPYFFNKICDILKTIQADIKKNYSNFEIFDIFKENKLVLFLLFEEKIIIPEKAISLIITNEKYTKLFYPQYFYPEFNSFYSDSLINEIKSSNPEIDSDLNEFNEKRKIGENDSHICNLIRNDSIEDFISLVNRSNISISSTLKSSIFETNPFLLNGVQTLIGYTIFFGSIQIFNYLRMNDVQLNTYLWLHLIHSQNPEIIHFFEENKIEPRKNYYIKCYKEAIKCHHLDIMNYIKENYYEKDETSDFSLFLISIKNYNFVDYLNNNYKTDLLGKTDLLYEFCKYDYSYIVSSLLKDNDFDINYRKVFLLLFDFI